MSPDESGPDQTDDATGSAAELFAEAYRAYLHAMKQAWAEVDVDELVQDAANDARQGGNGCQGCGEGFSCAGTVGTAATFGSFTGCVGTLGTVGTFGCSVAEEDDPGSAEDGRRPGYGGEGQ